MNLRTLAARLERLEGQRAPERAMLLVTRRSGEEEGAALARELERSGMAGLPRWKLPPVIFLDPEDWNA